MNAETNNWEENNQRYLTAAINWLRLRLMRLAQQPAPIVALADAAQSPDSSPGGWWRFWEKTGSQTAPRALLPPAPDTALVTDEQLSQAAVKVAEAEAVTPPPAIMAVG